VAVPLGVDVGVKLPHAALPQVTVHLTPALELSLLTTAVMLVVVPTTSELGGAALKATEMAGGGVGGVLDPPPPQAVSQTVATTSAKREATWRGLIECLHYARCVLCPNWRR